MLVETITWHELHERLPDADLTVLIEAEDVDGDPVTQGYLDGEQWRLVDGMPIDKVLRWAEMPKGGAA